ncbi:N-acetylmuramoyl-L-alanine amidase [Nocardia alni]|uniref:N-acetylmuramoyl-L-alanine amidase n=1 Tax=Nocardia alni TaxID=2815723 RepID=UPI0027E17C1B|nr:N-acetylmuramoyl-L-alanine amidase [Nocardia alni]
MFSRQLFYRKTSVISAGLCMVTAAATAAAFAPVASAVPAAPAPAPATSDIATKLAGKTVFLDPGHQGPNHTENLARQVNNGYGGTKECQTTGMTALDGTPEHTINWKVASLVKQSLEALGARVVLSRQDDTGWGGCVDDRAAAASRSGADVALSIHADSAPAQDRGFHLIVPQLPVPDARADRAQSGPGLTASKAMRDAYVASGFPAATYAGAVDGMQTRHDIAGPALTEVPDVFLEMGNGANKDDAAQLTSNDGQIKHAIAITTGLAGYLLGVSPTQQTGSAGSKASAPIPGQSNAVPAANNAPVPQPATPAAPQYQAAPGTYAPGGANSGANVYPGVSGPGYPGTSLGTNAAPGTNSYPGAGATPGAYTAPGAQPGTQAQPGAQTQPGTSNSTGDPNAAMSTLLNSAITLLGPLAKSLGVGDLANSELINLAYTLVSTLIGAAGNAASTLTK